jgi:hypothetical protein
MDEARGGMGSIDPRDRGNVLHLIEPHPMRPRLYFFGVVFTIPMVLSIAYVAVSNLGPNPVHIALWLWGVAVALSAGFGILAEVGFSSDIARAIDADERGVRVRFGSKERSCNWSDFRPAAVVFPGSVRFSCAGGFRPFFASLELTRELVDFEFAPSWPLPEDVSRKIQRLRDRSGPKWFPH